MDKYYLQDIKQRQRASNQNSPFLTPLFPLFLKKNLRNSLKPRAHFPLPLQKTNYKIHPLKLFLSLRPQ